MAHIPDAVSMLDRELREIFGARFRSLLAYGVGKTSTSHAHDHHHHAAPHASADTHTLAIVDEVTSEDLRACAGRTEKWGAAGLATPLLLAGHEFQRSLDAFPLEFGAILSDHVVVSGVDPLSGLCVDPADVRRACEVQARSHLLHLREGYLETRGRADALAVLIARSATPFVALLKSIARLEGVATEDEGAAARHVERALDLTGGIVSEVAACVRVHEIASADAVRIFPPYLDAVGRLVRYVDGWNVR